MKNLGLLALPFLFTVISAHANVQFTPTENIELEGSTCAEIERHAQSILNWTKSVVMNFNEPIPECFCSSSTCKINVLPISPAHVKTRTVFNREFPATAENGPNCFNNAFVISNTLTHIRLVHSDEATALYQSSLCEERSPSENLQPGDIIAIRDQSNKYFEVHAAIHISDGLMFSKKGFSPYMHYAYSQNDYELYGVTDQNCRRVFGIPKPGSPCYRKPFANVFTCKSFSKYISDLGDFRQVMGEKVADLYPTMSRLESKVAELALKTTPQRSQKVQMAVEKLREMKAQLDSLGDLSGYNSTQREFIDLMQTRWTSLNYQLGYISK